MPPSSSSNSKCPQCGESLPTDAVVGLCPRCLMVGAMQPTQADDQIAPMPILTPEELAPHFPQLEIIECLGRGGMGVVYKARQKSLNRLVALKLLAPERADDPQFAARFEKEAHALAALNHPHIVGVYDFGQAGGFYYLLMEFVDGVNLRQAMKAGRFTPEQALAIVPPVCEALQYAHDHGIVHRDIKPENLLLDKDGRVKIADFGIAKMLGAESSFAVPPSGGSEADRLKQGLQNLSDASMMMGTPQYMSPEQKAHGVTDHRADIYSLGVVLYEMLTGELPADKLQPPSRKVQIDVRLDEIVLRALEKTPELRFQTAVEFRTQVETMVLGRAGVPPAEPGVAPGSLKTNTDGRTVGGTPTAATGTVALPKSRFSRTAIVGACWLAIVPFHFVLPLVMPFGWANVPFIKMLAVFLALLFWTAPVGVTLLGWIAVTQIRRSAGKLYGLWLAVFDGLLFPLLAMNAVMLAVPVMALKLIPWQGMIPVYLTLLLTLAGLGLLALLIKSNVVIIRRVWRTVNASSSSRGHEALKSAPVTPPSPDNSSLLTSAATNENSTLGKWAFGLFLTGVLGTPLLVLLSKPGLAEALFFGVVALLLSLIFGLMSRRDR